VRSLLDVLERVADGVLANGFDALLFLNGHGGNASTVGDAVSIVGDAHSGAEVLGLTYFELAASFVHEVRESDTGGTAHAGEFETSLLLHLRSDLVDEDAMEGTYVDEPYERDRRDLLEGGPLSVYRTFDEYFASGAVGDPHLATAEERANLRAPRRRARGPPRDDPRAEPRPELSPGSGLNRVVGRTSRPRRRPPSPHARLL
jgi:creatinine amidohydrolase